MKINSYKNGILHDWMTARISFALTLPLCPGNKEKLQTLTEHEEIMLDDVFTAYGWKAGEYARRVLAEHPLYRSWDALEKTSPDMERKSVYLPRAVYNAVRADVIALNHAGLAEVHTAQCGEGVYLEVYACAQVCRKIDRIITALYRAA